MFRLVNFDEESDLYGYLSGIASETIFNALDNWAEDDSDIKMIYEAAFEDFEGFDEDLEEFQDLQDPENMENPEFAFDFGEADPADGIRGFFDGISDYLSVDTRDRWRVIDGRITDEDGRIGMEIIYRKLERMKEKMADPDHYYTFDLLEELLFHYMTEYYQVNMFAEMMEEEGIDIEKLDDDTELEIQMEYETEDEDMLAVMQTLVEDYGLEEEEAAGLTYPVFRPELMGFDIGEDSMFFWDNDFMLFFQNGFIPGILRMISGIGAALGYKYDNVREIFTDIGFKAPLSLIGTETAYNLRGEVVMKQTPFK